MVWRAMMNSMKIESKGVECEKKGARATTIAGLRGTAVRTTRVQARVQPSKKYGVHVPGSKS